MDRKRMARALLLSIVAVTLVLPSTLSNVSAQSVEIVSHSGFVDTIGYYRIFGEVQNIGSDNLTDVGITATFYNASHEEVGTAFAYTMLEVMLEGQKSPFAMVLVSIAQSAKVDYYSLEVTDYATYLGSKLWGLQIVSNSSSVILGYHVIEGEIKNIGEATTSFVKIVATHYNSTGHAVSAAFNYANPHTIAAGDTSPFEITSDWAERTPLIAEYTLTAESEEYTIIPEFPSWSVTLVLLVTLTGAIMVVRKGSQQALAGQR